MGRALLSKNRQFRISLQPVGLDYDFLRGLCFEVGHICTWPGSNETLDVTSFESF